MKIKNILMIMAFAMASGQLAHANLPSGAVTSMKVNVYGVYTTSDPLCKDGFVATMPITATPRTIDVATSPDLGTATFASPTNCIVFIIQNTLTYTWAAGNYTDMSLPWGTGVPKTDSVCNAGGSMTVTPCQSGSTFFPDKIKTDMVAAGVTPSSSCSGSSNEIFAEYRSTASACNKERAADESTSGCEWSKNGFFPRNNDLRPPGGQNDVNNGLHLGAPLEKSARYRLVVDPSVTFGGAFNGSSCGPSGPPRVTMVALKGKKKGS